MLPSMILTTDTELTQRAARGDRDAFARVYEDCFPAVWTFACRQTMGRPAAEALTSRVLRQTFGELVSYDAQIPFAAWLHALSLRVAASPSPRTARRGLPAPPHTTRRA